MTLLVWIRLPLVPVMINVYLPAGVVDVVFIESVDEMPVTGLGLKVPDVPEGRPDTLRATDPANPDNRVMVTV